MTDTKKDCPHIRRMMESTATIGLLLVAAGTLGPIFTFRDAVWPEAFKWIYALGALVYTVARAVGAFCGGESPRVRRLRRMELWAGLAFCVGSFFWFYNQARLMGIFTLGAVRDTIVFTLVGAVIQIVASWMISSRLRKELRDPGKE